MLLLFGVDLHWTTSMDSVIMGCSRPMDLSLSRLCKHWWMFWSLSPTRCLSIQSLMAWSTKLLALRLSTLNIKRGKIAFRYVKRSSFSKLVASPAFVCYLLRDLCMFFFIEVIAIVFMTLLCLQIPWSQHWQHTYSSRSLCRGHRSLCSDQVSCINEGQNSRSKIGRRMPLKAWGDF